MGSNSSYISAENLIGKSIQSSYTTNIFNEYKLIGSNVNIIYPSQSFIYVKCKKKNLYVWVNNDNIITSIYWN
jgi:hypothetical protein